MKTVKEHYATTEASINTYQVFYKNELILESNEVVELKEHYDGKEFPTVIYFPPSDISKLEISKTDLSTTCPIKGSASYWSYKEADNGIWAYENPFEKMSQMKGYYGFDKRKGFRVKRKME